MKIFIGLLSALPAVVWTSLAAASETKVIINLSEQRAYLIEQGEVTLVSPVASGKPGWATPTGNFRIFNKDFDHRSRSFGSVFDAYGRMVNSNATPGSHVPPGGHYSIRADAVFHGIQPSRWDARRLPSGVSRTLFALSQYNS